MSVSILMAALAVQTAAAPPRPALDVEIPAVEGVAADPTCGGRPAMTTLATCFVTTQAGAAALADAWNAAFAQQGWIAADGDDNRVVYVRRRPEGGCDGFQLVAFDDGRQVAAPAAPAYIALATIPGDVCAAQPAAPTPPAAPTTPQ
jgi:hypothetical protein